jgi:hypothetical protein
MNVEIGTEAAQFPENEYINGIFVAVNNRMVLLDNGVVLQWLHHKTDLLFISFPFIRKPNVILKMTGNIRFLIISPFVIEPS